MSRTAAWIIACDLEAVGSLTEEVRAFSLPLLGEEAAADMELAAAEAVTNVVRHGYGPQGGPLRVEIQAEPGAVVLRLFDWGRPIPGGALAEAGASRFDFDPGDLDSVPTGGMGLSLITMLVDEISYRSDEGQNVLTLRKCGHG